VRRFNSAVLNKDITCTYVEFTSNDAQITVTAALGGNGALYV
jgi:hypothetical protein